MHVSQVWPVTVWPPRCVMCLCNLCLYPYCSTHKWAHSCKHPIVISLNLCPHHLVHPQRITDCRESLKQLNELAAEADDLRAQALHDCCEFDALLEFGKLSHHACTLVYSDGLMRVHGITNCMQVLVWRMPRHSSRLLRLAVKRTSTISMTLNASF